MDPLETILAHLRPCRPLEVCGGLRPLLGYMYTLYITYARADDLSQTKRGSSEGVLCTKRGVLRGPNRPKRVHSDHIWRVPSKVVS